MYGFATLQLDEIALIKTGIKPDEILETKTDYEYINAGTTNSGYTISTNCKGDTVTTPSRGQGGIGFVGYQSKSFWLGPLCYQIRSKNKELVGNQYLYYYLCSHNDKILQCKNEGGVPSVNAIDLKKIMISIPNISEQEHIVSILSKVDKRCNDLLDGLSAEIEAREKQYQYYRDKLLSFKKLE